MLNSTELLTLHEVVMSMLGLLITKRTDSPRIKLCSVFWLPGMSAIIERKKYIAVRLVHPRGFNELLIHVCS